MRVQRSERALLVSQEAQDHQKVPCDGQNQKGATVLEEYIPLPSSGIQGARIELSPSTNPLRSGVSKVATFSLPAFYFCSKI